MGLMESIADTCVWRVSANMKDHGRERAAVHGVIRPYGAATSQQLSPEFNSR